jgi:hypothetical protein
LSSLLVRLRARRERESERAGQPWAGGVFKSVEEREGQRERERRRRRGPSRAVPSLPWGREVPSTEHRAAEKDATQQGVRCGAALGRGLGGVDFIEPNQTREKDGGACV